MVERNQPLVHLILNPSDAKKDDLPFCFLGSNRRSSLEPGDTMLNMNDISSENLHDLNSFITNLWSFFDNKLFCLSNTFSANRYLSPLCDNFLKGQQLLKILKTNSEIYLLVKQRDEIKLWKNFLTSNNIRVTSRLTPPLNFQIKTTTCEIIRVLKEYLWVKLIKKDKPPLSRLIFIHWVNEKNTSYNKVINHSSYFGDFLKNISQKAKVSLLGHILSDNRNFKDIIKSDFNFIKEYLSFYDILWSFFRSFEILFSVKNKTTFDNIDFTTITKYFLKRDFWDCSYLKHLLLYRCFKKICKNIPYGSTIVYPFENHPWERSLIMACNQQQHKINLLAYQFFPIPENFLIYHFSEKAKRYGLTPSAILTSDVYSDNLLAKEGIKTIKLGSLRYNNLLNKKSTIKAKNTILCSTFLDDSEAINISQQVVELAKSIECNFIINHHYLLSKNTLEKIKSVISTTNNVTLSDQKASELLNNVFLLIYNSSSVCLEAALRGIAVLYLPCKGVVNLDRLHGNGKTATDYADSISFIKKLLGDKNFYADYSNKIYKAANQMLFPYNENLIKEIIK